MSELRYALRSLHRSPGFALVAILTLALGMGASVAFFSNVYGIRLRPLEYGDADRPVGLRTERQFGGRARPVPWNLFLPDLEVWLRYGRAFDSVAMTCDSNASLAADTGSEVIGMATVTPSFFSTAGGRFVVGPGQGPADDASPSGIISRRLAQRVFGGATAIVGGQIALDREPYSMVDVADSTLQ